MELTKVVMVTVLLFVTATMSPTGLSVAAVHMVGDSAGWTTIGHPDYKKFHVGDTLIFCYHKQYHSVMEVSHRDYNLCNPKLKASSHSGSDSIVLTKPGHFYFICGTQGHCAAGQKLHTNVHPPLTRANASLFL